jgi:hypothetical protein
MTFLAPPMDKGRFITDVLKELAELGYFLQATVPMARRGLLGYKSRKEIWVFKGAKSSS